MTATPWTVTVHPYSNTGTDAYGNKTRTWGTSRSESVYGWAPGGKGQQAGGETLDSEEHSAFHGLDLYVPPDFECDPRDRITVDGLLYDVAGNVRDYTHGPFGFEPGGVVRLRRVEELA